MTTHKLLSVHRDSGIVRDHRERSAIQEFQLTLPEVPDEGAVIREPALIGVGDALPVSGVRVEDRLTAHRMQTLIGRVERLRSQLATACAELRDFKREIGGDQA